MALYSPSRNRTTSQIMRHQERLNSISNFGWPIDLYDVGRKMSDIGYRKYGSHLSELDDYLFDRINREAVSVLAENLRSQKYSKSQNPIFDSDSTFGGGSMSGSSDKKEKPKHQCCKECKSEHEDYYEGLVTYYRLHNPSVVLEEEKVCKKSACLVERIKIKLK